MAVNNEFDKDRNERSEPLTFRTLRSATRPLGCSCLEVEVLDPLILKTGRLTCHRTPLTWSHSIDATGSTEVTPRRLRIEPIVEQLLDPGGEQVLACAIPGVAQGPGTPPRGAWSAQFVRAHLDLARDRAASWSRLLGVSVACQEPAAGALISVNQKYGGPPWRSREVAATLPSGPVSESTP